MKKIFIALSVLAALIFSVAPSQALLGMPDDVPGNDVLLPFFIVSMPGHGNLNTLLVITDFKGGLSGPTAQGNPVTNFNYTIYTKRSATVDDGKIPGTKNDIISTDALTLLSDMAPAQTSRLEYDLDGDGTNDHWVGYIEFINVNDVNSVGTEILLADLAKGMVSGTTGPVREYLTTPTCDEMTTNAPNWDELFSPNALGQAKSLQDQDRDDCALPTNFGLYPRYYVNSANAKNYILLWKSFNNNSTTPFLPADGDYHVNWYDNDETPHSSSFPVPDELNIIDVEQYIPRALYDADEYPKEGWIEFEIGAGTGYNLYGDQEWLAYSWLRDVGTAAESWSILVQVWRDAWPPNFD